MSNWKPDLRAEPMNVWYDYQHAHRGDAGMQYVDRLLTELWVECGEPPRKPEDVPAWQAQFGDGVARIIKVRSDDLRVNGEVARQALLDAAQLLGWMGPGLYQSSDNYKGLIRTPAKYIDLAKRTAEIGESKPDGVFLKRLEHSTGFIGVECVRCEAEPIGLKHPDYCDACWSLEEKPKKGWVVFSGKVKDLASADLSGGWRGPGTYRLVPVGGVPKSQGNETIYKVETMGDLSDLLRNSTACGVEKVEVEK